MNEVLQNILTRRSARAYSEKQISDEDLELILEAARHAPSGGNSQSWHFTVIQNKEKLQKLNALVKESFKNLVVDENTYRSKINGKISSQNENYKFYYGAPTLILVSNDRNYPNAMADCAVSLQNIFLAAHSLGLGSCWINQIAWFCDEPDMRKALTEFGIPENYVVCGAAAIGYKDQVKETSVPRREGNVTIIK